MYDTIKARQAQEKYCKDHNAPVFTPYSGKCYSCGKDIYALNKKERSDPKTGKPFNPFISGITVEEAGSKLITGCPHCNKSFCD